MNRRLFLAFVPLAIGATCWTFPPSIVKAATKPQTTNVQVRVYRMPRRGVYLFLPNVKVQLDNGIMGVTSNQQYQEGCAYFYKLPKREYTGKAFVNGRWYQCTSIDHYGPNLRINVQIP